MANLTRMALATKFANLLADNTSGDISAADVREVLRDIIESMTDYLGEHTTLTSGRVIQAGDISRQADNYYICLTSYTVQASSAAPASNSNWSRMADLVAQAAADVAKTAADAAKTEADSASAAAATADGKAVAAGTAAANAAATANAALPRSGGTMTGKIVLDGAPTADLHAASKKYVDDNSGGAAPDLSNYLTRDGDLIKILGDIEDVVDYESYTGAWAAQAYTGGQVAKASNGQYYQAKRDLADTVPEPTATTADWEQLVTLKKSTADFHDYLTTLGMSGGGGDEESTGEIEITEVGTAVSVNNQTAVGPDVDDLTNLFLIEVTYTRTNANLHMWSVLIKSEDLVATEYRLQLQGGGGAYISFFNNNGTVRISNAGATGYSNITVRFFNETAPRGAPGPAGEGVTSPDGASRLLPSPDSLPDNRIVRTSGNIWVTDNLPSDGGGDGGGGGGTSGQRYTYEAASRTRDGAWIKATGGGPIIPDHGFVVVHLFVELNDVSDNTETLENTFFNAADLIALNDAGTSATDARASGGSSGITLFDGDYTPNNLDLYMSTTAEGELVFGTTSVSDQLYSMAEIHATISIIGGDSGTDDSSGTDNSALVVDVGRWQGAYDDNAVYVENHEIKGVDGNYYRAKQNVAAGTGSPIATDANWLQLSGLDLSIARFHEFTVEEHKIFTEDWGSLPLGIKFRVGDHVRRFEQWFVCEAKHNKGGTGPDNDPTNWSPVTNYAGEYDGAKWYHAGVYTAYRGKLAFSLDDIVPNDSPPDHATNVKWWYPPNDYNGIFRPWRYVFPPDGVDDLEIDSTNAASGQVETVTPDIDEDRILVHSIRAAEAAGIQTQMHISGTVKYFLKQDAPLSNSSGAILTVGLWVGADPRTGQSRFLHELDRNVLTLADFRNSNGGRDAYGTTEDVEKTFSLLVDETDFATWDLAQHEELVFILYGNNINGAASVKCELSDVVISYDRSTANIDHLREEIEDQLRALVQHQEIIVDELPDPAGAAAPDYAYLSRVWRPMQGVRNHQGVVEYSPGEYQRTTGTANRAKFLFSNGTYNDGSTDRDIIGFIQRGNRLRVGSAHFLSNVGEAIHNPVGGAVAGIFFTHDPSNVLAGGSASWVLWVKRSLASRKPPWNVPTNIEQGGFKVRLYHDSTSFDIKFAHGGSFEVIDGIEYEYYYAPTTTGLSWINNLNLNDVTASTIEIEFRRETDNVLYWLGDEMEGWTWRDPDENPTSISRIDKIERGSLVEGALLASISGPSSPGQLTNRAWTIPAGVSGVTQSNNNQHPTGNWTRYLYIDPDIYCHSLAGSHGILIVVKRGGSIVSSSYLPFTTAHAQWIAADEIFAGKWKTGVSHANTLYAGWGADQGRLHLTLACSGADASSTVEIHRTN